MQKTSPTVVTEQVLRFKDHPSFPGKEGQAALARAFRESCDSNEQVRAVGDYLVQTQDFSPVPAAIYRAAEELAQRRRAADEAQSPYKEPGDHLWHLAKDMDAAAVARMERLLEKGDRAQKAFAQGVLECHRRFEAERNGERP